MRYFDAMQILLLQEVADGFGNQYSALIATIGVVLVGLALVWAFYYDYQRNKRFRDKEEKQERLNKQDETA